MARISRLSSLAARPAPIVVGVSRSSEGLRVTAYASDRATEDALTLFGTL
jgi:hypothetical protein